MLQATTLVNAQLLGMGDQLGSLEPGKFADILVIEGRPDQDIDALRNVAMVFKGGTLTARIGTALNTARPGLPVAATSVQERND